MSALGASRLFRSDNSLTPMSEAGFLSATRSTMQTTATIASVSGDLVVIDGFDRPVSTKIDELRAAGRGAGPVEPGLGNAHPTLVGISPANSPAEYSPV